MDRVDLLLRRERLLMRSARLRDDLAQHAQALQTPLALADRAWALALYLRDHPAWPIGLAGAFLVLRPRGALRWTARLWWIWRAWRRARGWLDAGRREGTL